MLKILETKRKRASLGCRVAPLKNGSRIYEIPANGIHRAEPDQRHRLSIFYLAYGTFFMRMFLSAVAGEKTTPIFFFRQNSPNEHREVVPYTHLLLLAE